MEDAQQVGRTTRAVAVAGADERTCAQCRDAHKWPVKASWPAIAGHGPRFCIVQLATTRDCGAFQLRTALRLCGRRRQAGRFGCVTGTTCFGFIWTANQPRTIALSACSTTILSARICSATCTSTHTSRPQTPWLRLRPTARLVGCLSVSLRRRTLPLHQEDVDVHRQFVLDLLDAMHCHLVHSYDACFRMRNLSSTCDEDAKQANPVLNGRSTDTFEFREKRAALRTSRGAQRIRRNNSNKYFERDTDTDSKCDDVQHRVPESRAQPERVRAPHDGVSSASLTSYRVPTVTRARSVCGARARSW